MGWRTVWSNSFWVWFYYAYYVAFALASLVLVSRFRSTTRVFRERKQADLILGTGIATLLLGTTTDVVIPQLTRLHTPDLAGALCLVWAAGLYVAVTRYGLMSVTAQAAADEILATMADALLLLTPEGKVVAANNGATRLLGRSAAELRDRPAEQFFGAPEQFRQALARVGDEVALTAIELECRGKDGRLTPVSVSSRLMRDRGGETVGSVWVLRDITARRQAEERQSQLLAEVEAANRELNSFAYVVSHDLKAPLRAIDSLVKWLLSDYQDRFDEPGREMVALLIGRVKRMHDLIDGVLQYSRAGRALEESGDVKVATVIADVVAALAPPVHIKVQVEGDFPTVRAAKVKLEQVFQNLLSNAIKYMDKPKGLVRVACTRENGSWKFSVSDNGPGIDRKDFERVFQLFATLKPRDQTESTGVGLSVVKKIVELYGGRVWVESTLGEGSTFHFTLPRMQDA
jgi:PAS domain S-box-containing protein